ncbi:YlbF family regulator [Melioribacteraceae bacterium 4301-Me]|uniref:YlbF family regulator n=1 Tax=Pyranulibacter aquaticus TaxID=3163344 RepID=UPI00359AC26D
MDDGNSEVYQIVNERVKTAAKALGNALLKSEAYINFIKARDQFRMDETAKEAAREYNAVLNDYQMRARFGGITPDDETKIQEAQKVARQNIVLDNYYKSQENLIAFYQELNAYLSDKLKFDFASLAKPPSSCCG